MNCIDARNGIDAIFILYEFNCLIAEENRVLPLVTVEIIFKNKLYKFDKAIVIL